MSTFRYIIPGPLSGLREIAPWWLRRLHHTTRPLPCAWPAFRPATTGNRTSEILCLHLHGSTSLRPASATLMIRKSTHRRTEICRSPPAHARRPIAPAAPVTGARSRVKMFLAERARTATSTRSRLRAGCMCGVSHPRLGSQLPTPLRTRVGMRNAGDAGQ